MDDLPKTRKEATETGSRYYFTGKPCKRGHIEKRYVPSRKCMACVRAASRKRYHADVDRRREKARKENRVKRARNPEKARAQGRKYAAKFRKNNPELHRQRSRAAAAKKRRDAGEELNARARQYYTDNLQRMRMLKQASTALYRAAKLQRTPPWTDLEAIKAIYKNCPPGHHVDHVIPLQGKTVSGLHVAANLQYLPARENLSKGNKWQSAKAS